jgi:murein L,D-transpeptidase YafK
MHDRRANSFAAKAARALGVALVMGVLAGCQADELGYGPKHLRSISEETDQQIAELGMSLTSPVLMRIFKEENKFEVWKQDKTGKFALLKTYDICKWSGNLGPKVREGDRQAPEGYYTITPGLMNPNSQYYLAFNTGFPNAYDRANGRTGSALMVHGACSSRGCYAMTDEQIQEIYALARDAFRGGQTAFQLAAYPFKMTPENMASHWNDPNMPFWKMLKEGYDTFELTRQQPKVDVCARRYVFNATTDDPLNPVSDCPELAQPADLKLALQKKAKEDEEKAIVIVAKLEEEKKTEEARQLLIAQNIEAERRRNEERQLAAAQPGPGLASIFGLASAAPETAPETPPESSIQPETTTASGDPLPRRNPRQSDDTALAMAPGQSAPPASMFSRLFSFGDEAPAEAPPETLTAATAPTVDTETPMAVAATPVPIPAARNAAAAAVPASAPATTPSTPVTVAATQPCALPGAVAPAGTPVCEPAASPPLDEASKGIMNRIGNWF